MLGSSGLLALCVLAASPAGSATISDCPDDGSTVRVTFLDAQSLEAKTDTDSTDNVATKVVFRATYEDKQLPPAAGQEGIRGLPPLPNDTPSTSDTGAPAPLSKLVVPKPLVPKSTLPEQAPSAQTLPRSFSNVGEAACGDQCEGNPCVGVCQCSRPSWFRNWLDGVGFESWIDQGVTINTLSPRDRINGPVTFNNQSNDYQLNQAYLRLKRDVNSEDDTWDVGGRIDLLYGTDSFFTTARGLETFDDFAPKWNAQQYGLAMPQCYAEVFAPWGNGVSVKLGHFYSGFGYETVTAPDNFFYSHSYVFQYGEPFTYTGFIGTTMLGDFKIQAGMTRGWDNWEDNNNDLAFTGAISWESDNKRTKITFDVDAGREQPDPSTNIRTLYSLIIEQKLGEYWEYVIQHDFASEPGAGVDGTVASWYGVDQYLYRTINDTWKAGMRFEWFRDENGSRVPVPGGPQTGDYFELTVGANWRPNERFVVRPELRWDWTGTAGLYPFGDGTRSNQLLLDCDAIVRF